MNNNEVEGLLAVEVVRKGNAFRLIYHLTGLISLRDFLLTPMDRQVFVRLLSLRLRPSFSIEQPVNAAAARSIANIHPVIFLLFRSMPFSSSYRFI